MMKTKLRKLIIATFVGGFGMWVVAGLWHNLILPNVDENVHPHHEGLGLLLVAYFILAILMAYIYSLSYKGVNPIMEGLRLGVVVGLLWVFPHGLAMASTHSTSIVYEINNAIWHIVEQGIGGVIIALVYGRKEFVAMNIPSRTT